MNQRRPIILWRFTDGKPGHDKQTEGLSRALQEIVPCEVINLPVRPALESLLALAAGRPPAATQRHETPDLALGAGHATHLSLLATRRATGARIVVCMKPGLPCQWFDLCLVPQHDRVNENDHIVLTRGALNTQAPGDNKRAGTGLILIGGISRHFEWQEDRVLQQVKTILAANTSVDWKITDSRRTPATTTSKLAELGSGQVAFVPYNESPSDWLDRELRNCETAWVSADSVSMIYEAVTAGCKTGIIEPGHSKHGKIARSVQDLIEDHMATSYSEWEKKKELRLPRSPLNEAGRCARLIHERFLSVINTSA
ncbi:MAG: ELM1/GtrOC1 family putative glycosyltransferase [Gammaproteobacteria bacterium]|nr:ELM1/GtrOC1 family putative glycosyltransferase [Gammaproteobacteria bacterium]